MNVHVIAARATFRSGRPTLLSARALFLFALLAGAFGCGSRPGSWNDTPAVTASVGLANGVALLDAADHRVVLVGANSKNGLEIAPTVSLPVGRNVVSTQVSPDGTHLFVLATGDWPPRSSTDELPSLTVIDTTNWAAGQTPKPTRYWMTQPFPNLAIDPVGTKPAYAVAYQGAGNQSVFVENPNELAIFDLSSPYAKSTEARPNPVVHTIQSFGGTPQALTFTPSLLVNVTQPPRRLLIVQTQIDVTLFDLDHAFDQPLRPEITVPLTTGTTPHQVTPAAVAVDSFDSQSASDARIAVRASNDTNVYTIAFAPPDPGAANDFKPTVNLTDVGGVPTDIAFVHTDAGLRLAALVPTRGNAVLVEPDTSLTTAVAMPSNYSNMSLVTAQVAIAGTMPGSGVDVALLWNGGTAASGVALWTLSNSVGQPYFSVQVLDVLQAVARVDDVPNSNLKVLESTASQFFVLNLATRTVYPLDTSSRVSLTISADGARVWAFTQGGEDLASIPFASLNPTQLVTDAPIAAVYDVACLDDPSSRALFALDNAGTGGATVFNAVDVTQTAPPLRVAALLLQGTP